MAMIKIILSIIVAVLYVILGAWFFKRADCFPIHQRQPKFVLFEVSLIVSFNVLLCVIYDIHTCDVAPSVINSFLLALFFCLVEIRLKHHWWRANVHELLTNANTNTKAQKATDLSAQNASFFTNYAFLVSWKGDLVQLLGTIVFAWIIPFLCSGILSNEPQCWSDWFHYIMYYTAPSSLHAPIWALFYYLLRKNEDKFFFNLEAKLYTIFLTISVIDQSLVVFGALDINHGPYFGSIVPILGAVLGCLGMPLYKSYASYAPLKLPLASFLRDEACVQAFMNHLRKEFSTENLLFWLDAQHFFENFANFSSEVANKTAGDLYSRYIVNPNESLNLPFQTLENLKKVFELNIVPLSATVYVEAQEQILDLMSRDSYLRFAATDPQFPNLVIFLMSSGSVARKTPRRSDAVDSPKGEKSANEKRPSVGAEKSANERKPSDGKNTEFFAKPRSATRTSMELKDKDKKSDLAPPSPPNKPRTSSQLLVPPVTP